MYAVKYRFDVRKLNRFKKERRGQGKGKHYAPFLTVRDFSSKGRVHRVKGLKSGRVHHLFSDGEWMFFLELDWNPFIKDIREQFPLDRFRTFQIANQLGYRHPTCTDGSPMVMTTDFVIDMFRNGQLVTIARTFKQSKDLNDKRTREKLKIEKAYWESLGVEWSIVTERELNKTLINNVATIRPFFDMGLMKEPVTGMFQKIADAICDAVPLYSNTTLGGLCSLLDDKFNVRSGMSYDVARHLMANWILVTDMEQPERFPLRPLSEFLVNR